MSVAIIDYGSGNLHSAAKAFERAARDSGLAARIDVTADPAVVRRASRIVLPGVGAFKDCRDGLKAVPGMWETLVEQVHGRGKPFLGICVGMQLMATRTWDGIRWTSSGRMRCLKASPWARKGCMPISCIPSILPAIRLTM
jgi:imidazole glycerol-phosphate synthase subunit HisH